MYCRDVYPKKWYPIPFGSLNDERDEKPSFT